MQKLTNQFERVSFSSRSGVVLGYVTVTRKGEHEKPETYYVVELDEKSRAYLEGEKRDCFVSMLLVHVDNVD